MSELVEFQFIKTSTKFLLWISVDAGSFDYVLYSFGLKIDTDVGINGYFAPFRLVGTQYLNLDA